jgi:hypothetical protein
MEENDDLYLQFINSNEYDENQKNIPKKVISGSEFNRFCKVKLFKVLNEDLTSRQFKFQYVNGCNEDIFTFQPEKSCRCGGLYFTTEYYFYKWINNTSYYAVPVTIPNDALVYLESYDKFKADKIILEMDAKINLDNFALWEKIIETKHLHKYINENIFYYIFHCKYPCELQCQYVKDYILQYLSNKITTRNYTNNIVISSQIRSSKVIQSFFAVIDDPGCFFYLNMLIFSDEEKIFLVKILFFSLLFYLLKNYRENNIFTPSVKLKNSIDPMWILNLDVVYENIISIKKKELFEYPNLRNTIEKEIETIQSVGTFFQNIKEDTITPSASSVPPKKSFWRYFGWS